MGKHTATPVQIYRNNKLVHTSYSQNDASKWLDKPIHAVRHHLLTKEPTNDGYTLKYQNEEMELERQEVIKKLLDNYIVPKMRSKASWHTKLNANDLPTLKKVLALLEDEDSGVYSLRSDSLLG